MACYSTVTPSKRGKGGTRRGNLPSRGIMLHEWMHNLKSAHFMYMNTPNPSNKTMVFLGTKLVRSLGKISCAAACFSLHLWVPTLLCQVELTCKRQHAQHCWAKLITFTIRIVCSGFVDIHHSQMAQSVVAHMQTVLCLDVAHQTERFPVGCCYLKMSDWESGVVGS